MTAKQRESLGRKAIAATLAGVAILGALIEFGRSHTRAHRRKGGAA